LRFRSGGGGRWSVWRRCFSGGCGGSARIQKLLCGLDVLVVSFVGLVVVAGGFCVVVGLARSFVLRWWFFPLRRKFNNNYQRHEHVVFLFLRVFLLLCILFFIGEFSLFVLVCYGNVVAAELVMVFY
jgi:hypothetical protein